MAGQPRWRTFLTMMADGDREEWVFEQLGSGRSLLWCARQLGTSRSTMWRWVCVRPERKERYLALRRDEAAAAMVERAEEVLETADENTPGGVSKAKALADQLRWQASKANRAEFGEQTAGGGGVLVIGDLHLQALIQRGGVDAAVPLLPKASRPAEVLDGTAEALPAEEKG